MKKKIKDKLMPILLMLSLLLSAVAIIPQVSADPFVFPDGLVSKTMGLTCGEPVVYQVKDGSLDPETDYVLQIDATSGWIDLEGEESDEDGDLIIEFETPGWGNLDENPIGTWDLRLWDADASAYETGYGAQIDIDNLYHVRIKYGGDWLDNLIYNTTYTPVYFYAYNWTGSKYEECDFDLDFMLYQPDGTTEIAEAEDISDGIWDLDLIDDDLNYNNGDGSENLEYYCPLTIDDGSHTTTQAIPILLDVTADLPDDAEWGDTIYVNGYVRDGQDKGIGGYDVKLYSPTNGSYVEAATATTYATGRYYMIVDTGKDDEFSAGVWYVGAWFDSSSADLRVNESDMYEHLIGGYDFIRYYFFEVASDDSAEVKIEDPDEIMDGFDQTINVSAKWDHEPFEGEDEDAIDTPAAIHITGVDGYDWGAGEEFDEDDYYFVGWTSYDSEEDESTVEFTVQFNDTGTLTVYLTWPYQGDIYFENEYNNTDYYPNITGSVDINVGAMNMVVENMPDEVMIDISGDCWLNTSDLGTVIIDLYGDTSSDLMNATIMVTGCGLDFTIPEDDDPEDNEYLVDKDEGMYEVVIVPKTGGTLTVTAENDTEELSVTKYFKVSGLRGTITTSVGDDKKITFGTTETIAIEITNGHYSSIHLTWLDKNWDNAIFINKKVGDGETPGEGLNGIFEFVVTEDDIPYDLGYIVIVATTGGLYFYDIVEIEKPILKNIFIIGRITNLNQLEETSTFNSIRVRCINLSTFSKNKYQSNEKIIISNNYIGILTKWYILGFFEGALA